MGHQKSDATCTSNACSYTVVNDQKTQKTDGLNLLYLYTTVFAFRTFFERKTSLINISFKCSCSQNNELGKNKKSVQHLFSTKTPILNVIGLEKDGKQNIECNMGI